MLTFNKPNDEHNRGLADLDFLSKSDPQCFVFLMDPKTRTWCKEPIGKTEMVLNKLECEFVKSIIIDYRFEAIQPIRFTVVDVDNRNDPSWTAQELVGHFDTEVGKIGKGKESGVSFGMPP